MIGDILEVYIRLTGGFWSFRERMLRCKTKKMQRFYQVFYYLYLKRNGGYIGHTASFSSEPCFPHGLHGVFIAGGASFGNNCVIFHHVTVGANPMPFSATAGTPKIGDNCYIGAGATIIGSVVIGDNCRIGSNCNVFSDIANNSIAVTEKPRIIKRDTPLVNKYYRWSPSGPIYFDHGRWVLETDEKIIESLNRAL